MALPHVCSSLPQKQPAEGACVNTTSSNYFDIFEITQQYQYTNRNRNKDVCLNFSDAKNKQERMTCREGNWTGHAVWKRNLTPRHQQHWGRGGWESRSAHNKKKPCFQKQKPFKYSTLNCCLCIQHLTGLLSKETMCRLILSSTCMHAQIPAWKRKQKTTKQKTEDNVYEVFCCFF